MTGSTMIEVEATCADYIEYMKMNMHQAPFSNVEFKCFNCKNISLDLTFLQPQCEIGASNLKGMLEEACA